MTDPVRVGFDPQQIDETGNPWIFLDEFPGGVAEPGMRIVSDDEDESPAVVERIVPTGHGEAIVSLRLLEMTQTAEDRLAEMIRQYRPDSDCDITLLIPSGWLLIEAPTAGEPDVGYWLSSQPSQEAASRYVDDTEYNTDYWQVVGLMALDTGQWFAPVANATGTTWRATALPPQG